MSPGASPPPSPSPSPSPSPPLIGGGSRFWRRAHSAQTTTTLHPRMPTRCPCAIEKTRVVEDAHEVVGTTRFVVGAEVEQSHRESRDDGAALQERNPTRRVCETLSRVRRRRRRCHHY